MRAYSPTDILKMRKKTIAFEGDWQNAFGTVEMRGVWFIWGNSGNGKSSFVMQLCKELTKYGKVAYNSLEEGSSLTMQNSIRNFGMDECARRFQIIDCEPMDQFSKRLEAHKSAAFAVIDSFQYSQLTYKLYLKFKERHRDKLIIFISHADGKSPSGRSARSVMYDATLKIWVEGFVAHSQGRFIGPTGKFTIWKEGAERHWGGEQ